MWTVYTHYQLFKKNALEKTLDTIVQKTLNWAWKSDPDCIPTYNITVKGPKTKLSSQNWRSRSTTTQYKHTQTVVKTKTVGVEVEEKGNTVAVKPVIVGTKVPVIESTCQLTTDISLENLEKKTISIKETNTTWKTVSIESLFPGFEEKVVQAYEIERKMKAEQETLRQDIVNNMSNNDSKAESLIKQVGELKSQVAEKEAEITFLKEKLNETKTIISSLESSIEQGNKTHEGKTKNNLLITISNLGKLKARCERLRDQERESLIKQYKAKPKKETLYDFVDELFAVIGVEIQRLITKIEEDIK
jgi:hypothetical protein